MIGSEEDQYPWSRLGLEKTADPKLIKSAYAKLLRTAKPDEDTEGYQALRSAYDFALFLAKNPAAQFEAANDSVDAPAIEQLADNSDLFASLPQSAQPLIETRPLTEPPTSVDPTVEDSLRRNSPFSVLALNSLRQNIRQSRSLARDELEQALGGMPLDERHLANQLFADWILEDGRPSKTVASVLDEYFHWRNDYQIERVLGWERADKLRRKLRWLLNGETQIDASGEFDEALTLSSLIDRGKFFEAILFSFAASATMFRILGDTWKSGVEYLGAPRDILKRAASIANLVFWIRTVVFMLGVVVCSSLFSKKELPALFAMSGVAIVWYMISERVFEKIVVFNARIVIPRLSAWIGEDTSDRYEFSETFNYAVFAGFAVVAGCAAYLNAFHTPEWPLKYDVLALIGGVLLALLSNVLVCSRICTPHVWLPLLILLTMTITATTGDKLNILSALAASGVLMSGLRIELITTTKHGERTMEGFMFRVAVFSIFLLVVGAASSLTIWMWLLAYLGAHFSVAYLCSISPAHGLAILWISFVAVIMGAVEMQYALIIVYLATALAFFAEMIGRHVKQRIVEQMR